MNSKKYSDYRKIAEFKNELNNYIDDCMNVVLYEKKYRENELFVLRSLMGLYEKLKMEYLEDPNYESETDEQIWGTPKQSPLTPQGITPITKDEEINSPRDAFMTKDDEINKIDDVDSLRSNFNAFNIDPFRKKTLNTQSFQTSAFSERSLNGDRNNFSRGSTLGTELPSPMGFSHWRNNRDSVIIDDYDDFDEIPNWDKDWDKDLNDIYSNNNTSSGTYHYNQNIITDEKFGENLRDILGKSSVKNDEFSISSDKTEESNPFGSEMCQNHILVNI